MTAFESAPQPLPANVKPDRLQYHPPPWLRNGHIQSVWPTLFRKVDMISPQAEILPTDDDDELHLDWYRQGSDRLAIVSHGL